MSRKIGAVFMSIAALVLCYVLTLPALAADRAPYADVPVESPWHDGVEFVTEQGISNGVGENLFAPERLITNQQWIVMLCRAFCPDLKQEAQQPFGMEEMGYALEQGWIDEDCFQDPEALAHRGNMTTAALKAADIECFSYELEPDGYPLAPNENSVRIGKEMGLIDSSAASNDQITRGEAAHILYLMLSGGVDEYTPAMASEINLINRDGKKIEPYLEQINMVPGPIREKFSALGWRYILDTDYLEDYSRTFGQTCIGLCDYANRCLYLSEPGPTLHEFGHFYHSTLGFPEEIEGLFNEEAPNTPGVLRKYSLTNPHEYFADYFAYCVKNSGNEDALDRLETCSPKTYSYLSQFITRGWKSE